MNEINEEQINPSDVKAIFKSAENLRTNPTGLRKHVKYLQKDQISFHDLQTSWKENGFPSDTDEIIYILKNHGYGDKEIDRVFSTVFGKSKEDNNYNYPESPDQIKKLASIIKKRGLEDQIKNYMLKTYGEELGLTKKPTLFSRIKNKLTNEEVRMVFEKIISEDRSQRQSLIQQYRQENLGRQKK